MNAYSHPRPPTPVEVLDQIVAQHVPGFDTNLPFNDPRRAARKRLAVLMLVEVYGESHPISQFAATFNLFDRNPSPTDDQCEAYLEKMRFAWNDIRHMVEEEMSEGARE